ncbi:MAG: LacI family DNA-binding transcriptional regulator [Candidimonas sp.]|nr:MAG: LacI family DNA-binding transcriptional regulator [Candidimonas sp.]
MPPTHPRTRKNEVRATIKDVAREAGVSVASASRALHNPGRVSAAMVEKVRIAADLLEYVPYRAAGYLVSKKFNAIGAIVPTIDNAIFAQALHALQNQLNLHGYTLILASTHYSSEREVAETQALIEHGVDAIVLVGEAHDEKVLRLLEGKHVPYINTWTYNAGGSAPCAGFDNRAAMVRLTNYLLDLGHRRFAVIAGITDKNDRAAERLEGVRDALAARGMTLQKEQIEEMPYTVAAGRQALRKFACAPTPPTAVICGNDILAFGAIYECIARKIAVPQTLSITGYDDFELSSHMSPALTTIRVPAIEMGVGAADYLVSYLAGKPMPKYMEYEAELIVRESTAPPPRAR